VPDNIGELREIEADCVQKLKKKAAELRASNPRLTASTAMGQAAAEMPEISNRYNRVRLILASMGVVSLPLH
jgi:hypothetical protein